MPVVGLAEVLVRPIFTDSQRTISREMGPAATAAGRSVGRSMGSSMAEGFSQETGKFEAAVEKAGKAVVQAQEAVTKAREKSTKATEAQQKSVRDLGVAEQRLQEAYNAKGTKLSRIQELQNRLEESRRRLAHTTQTAIDANRELDNSTNALSASQQASASASRDMSRHMQRVARETERANTVVGRFQNSLRNAVRGRPLGEWTQTISRDSNQISKSMDEMAESVEHSGTRGGRAFTRFLGVTGAVLTGIVPLVGAMSGSLLAGAAAVTTLASSFQQLGGVAALIPAGLLAVGAAAGTLKAAFFGIGEALQAAIESEDRLATMAENPRLQAMAIEDAQQSIVIAEENAARARVDAARRVRDAKRALQDTIDAAADAEEAAAERIEQAERDIADSRRALQDTIRAVADAEEAAADRRVEAARAVEDARRDLEDTIESVAETEEAAAERRVQAARNIEEARRSLQDVIESAAEAEEAASRRVEQAQRSEEEAARGVIEAQKSLAEARVEAVERVDEVGRAKFDADRDAVDAALAYQEAVSIYNKAKADPSTTSAELAQLNNDVARAYAADFDAKNAVKELAAEHKKAQQEAKTGTEAVKAAEQDLADARQAEKDAIRDRKDAQAELVDQQEDGARRIKDAQLAINDAIKAQREAQEDAADAAEEGAERIADARRNVTDAIKAQKQAQEDADQTARDGARDIADAQRDVADAIEARQQAREDAGEAAEDSAQAIADAEENVQDAITDSKQSQVDSARAVEQAHRNLERVQIQQAEQAKQAGEQSEQAMSKLTPAAQRAVRALLSVYDQLGNIRRIAQENFFRGFVGPLMNLASVVMPQLAVGVGAIATALGGGAQQLMNSLADAFSGGVLKDLLLTVAETIEILNGAIDPAVQSFVTLGVVGMKYMPRLARFVRQLTEDFNKFIQAAAADGRLDTWIEQGIQGFKDLASIIGSSAAIFSAWNKAARAGGIDVTLASVAHWLNRVEEIMEGPVFQKTMSTIFAGAAASAAGLAVGARMIGEALVQGAVPLANFLRLGGEIFGLFVGGIAKALADPEFGAGMTAFLTGVRQGVEAMVPLMPGLTAAFGQLLTALAPIVRELGPTLVSVFTLFAEAVANVITFLDPLLVTIASSTPIMAVLIGAFIATAGASAALTAAANLQKVATAALWVVTKSLTVAQYAAAIAQGLFTVATGKGIRALVKNKIALKTARIALAAWAFTQKAATFATTVGAKAVGLFSLAVRKMKLGAARLALLAWAAAQRVAAIATGLGTAAIKLFSLAIKRIPVIGWIITGITLLTGALVWFFTQTEIGKKIWDTVWTGIKDTAKAVWGWFQNTFVPGFLKFFRDLPANFNRIGEDIIVGLLDGITGGKGQVFYDAIRGFVMGIVNWVKDLFGIKSPSTVFRGIGINIARGLLNGINFIVTWVKDVFWKMVDKVESAVNHLRLWLKAKLLWTQAVWHLVWTTIKRRVLGIFDDIVDGITDSVNSVRFWMRDKLEWLQAVWSLVWTAIKRKVSNIWDDMTDIIKDTFNAVRFWVRDKINWLRNTWADAWDAIKGKAKAIWEGIESVIRSAWNAIKDKIIDPMIDFVKNKIPDAFEDAKDGIGKAWDKIKDIAKKPVKFVINRVINDGLIDTFNKIPGVDIKHIELPKGFRKGGYTGDGNPNELAGGVHKKEFVFTDKQTAAIGKDNLERMAHAAVRGERGAFIGGSGGGYLMPRDNQWSRAGEMNVETEPGWYIHEAVKAWKNVTGIDVKAGSGFPRVNTYASPLAGYPVAMTRWGSRGTEIQFDNNKTAGWSHALKRGTAIHEIGHALGLPHVLGRRSIMDPMMRDNLWPNEGDRDLLRGLYGRGKGQIFAAADAKPENPFIGIVDSMMGLLTKAFPQSGMIIEAVGGLVKAGIREITGFMTDIKQGIINIGSNVVNGIKDFFGWGAGSPDDRYNGTLNRDTGGIIPRGISQIVNRTGHDEYALNPQGIHDVNELYRIASARMAGGAGGDTYYVDLPQEATVNDFVDAVNFQKRKNARSGR